jgi:hypothetical protein
MPDCPAAGTCFGGRFKCHTIHGFGTNPDAEWFEESGIGKVLMARIFLSTLNLQLSTGLSFTPHPV